MYLFFPGNNRSNRQWCENLRDSFTTKQKLMLYYDHWNTGGDIDWNIELNKIAVLKKIEGNTYLVGKSAGCILGLKANMLGYLNVDRFIFIGFPYYWAKQRGDDDTDYLLDNLKTKSLFIQKPKDPVIGYDELKSILNSKNLNISTLEYVRDEEVDNNHDYDDISYLVDTIKKFVI